MARFIDDWMIGTAAILVLLFMMGVGAGFVLLVIGMLVLAKEYMTVRWFVLVLLVLGIPYMAGNIIRSEWEKDAKLREDLDNLFQKQLWDKI